MKLSKAQLLCIIQLAAYGYGLVNGANDSIENIESSAKKYRASPRVQQFDEAVFEIQSILDLIELYEETI